jgi:hypothetical protein
MAAALCYAAPMQSRARKYLPSSWLLCVVGLLTSQAQGAPTTCREPAASEVIVRHERRVDELGTRVLVGREGHIVCDAWTEGDKKPARLIGIVPKAALDAFTSELRAQDPCTLTKEEICRKHDCGKIPPKPTSSRIAMSFDLPGIKCQAGTFTFHLLWEERSSKVDGLIQGLCGKYAFPDCHVPEQAK